MKNINFNTKIKSLLAKHTVPSDHDAIWQHVNATLNQRKRKKRFIVFFIIPLAVAALFSSFYMLQNEKLSPNNLIHSNQELSDNNQTMAAAKSLINQSNNSKNIQSVSDAPVNEGTSSQSDENIGNRNLQSFNKPLNSKSSSKSVLNKNNIENSISTTISIQPESLSNNTANSKIEKLPTQTINQTLTNTEININSFSSLSSEIQYDNNYNLSLPTLRDKVDFINQPISPWKIGFYFAPGLFSRRITALNDDVEIISLASKRSKFEQAVEELSFGTEVAFNLNENWSISTGLEYSKLIEKFEASYSDTTTKLEDNVLLGIVLRSTNQQQLEKVFGSAPVTTIKSVYRKTYNRYHILSLPVLLNYQINLNRVNFGVHGGISMQSLFSVSGNVLDVNGLSDLSSLELNNQKVYTSSFHFNTIIGLDLLYQASDNLSVYIAPEAILGLNGLSDRSSGLRHSIDRYRLRIGTRYNL